MSHRDAFEKLLKSCAQTSQQPSSLLALLVLPWDTSPTLPGSSTESTQQGAPDLIQPYGDALFDWLMPMLHRC